MSIERRYQALRQEVDLCCREAGRDPSDVRILAVSKTVGNDALEEAVQAGIHEFGENRPASLVEKQEAFPEEHWHFIGNIQSRRIQEIVSASDLIHSVYQVHHLAKIESSAQSVDKIQDILLEVNVSGEASKSGLEPEQLRECLDESLHYPHVRVCGLMTMAPQGDLVMARTCFAELARLLDEMQKSYSGTKIATQLHELSMGMSEDWREAIETGATIIRLGRALFNDDF